jgi:hypothetical protein
MKTKSILYTGASLALAVLLGSGLTYAAPENTDQAERGGTGTPTTFSGRATVVDATVLGIRTVLSETGDVDPAGGALEASLLQVRVPGVIDADVLSASTIAQGDRSRSRASVADVNVTALNAFGQSVSASFLRSNAQAFCGIRGASAFGSSEIVNLVINGNAIVVTGEPGQTITLPGGAGSVVINEQIQSSSGRNNADLTVNALHIILLDPLTGAQLVNVVIASSHADINCATSNCTGRDFITGGGWIISPGRNTFGVAAGLKNRGFWGHLTYIDHTTGMKVKATSITNYISTGATMRQIMGTADIDGVAGTFTVDLADNGEPGGNDTFKIHLSTGYMAMGNLVGGNIQLHKPCR